MVTKDRIRELRRIYAIQPNGMDGPLLLDANPDLPAPVVNELLDALEEWDALGVEMTQILVESLRAAERDTVRARGGH